MPIVHSTLPWTTYSFKSIKSTPAKAILPLVPFEILLSGDHKYTMYYCDTSGISSQGRMGKRFTINYIKFEGLNVEDTDMWLIHN